MGSSTCYAEISRSPYTDKYRTEVKDHLNSHRKQTFFFVHRRIATERVQDLIEKSVGTVREHYKKTTRQVPGRDFRRASSGRIKVERRPGWSKKVVVPSFDTLKYLNHCRLCIGIGNHHLATVVDRKLDHQRVVNSCVMCSDSKRRG